jgi:hypothetical protein
MCFSNVFCTNYDFQTIELKQSKTVLINDIEVKWLPVKPLTTISDFIIYDTGSDVVSDRLMLLTLFVWKKQVQSKLWNSLENMPIFCYIHLFSSVTGSTNCRSQMPFEHLIPLCLANES